jgi:IPTL-CTERM motif
MIRSHVPYINKSFVFATLFRIGRLMTLTMFILCSGLLILLTTTFNTYESSAQDPINVPIDNPINVPLPNPEDDNTITTPADPIKDPAPPIESDPAPPIESDPAPPIESDPAPPIESDPAPPIESDPAPPIESDPAPPIESDPAPPIESEPPISPEEPNPQAPTCNRGFGDEGETCVGGIPHTVTAIPTLSEWGLIAMAGILGIVGFMVIRRRKASA